MGDKDVTKKAKTVEEHLNTIDYSIDPFYVPSDFALEFVSFIKLVNGAEGEENETPVLHYKMLDQVAGSTANIANLVHRGAAKTTVLAEYLFLYLAVYGEIPGFGDIPLAIYVSDSIDNGVKNMRKNLEFRWENSEFLQQYLPNIRFTDIRWEFNNVDGRRFIVKAYGAKTGVRGTKEMGIRPVLAVLDDLLSDEDARSETVIGSIEDTVYKAIDYAMHTKKSKIIWSGTPFNQRDPLYKAVESGAWAVNVYPVCEVFPCEREDFRGSWPDRFTYDYVKKKYTKALLAGKIETFNQELMLRIMSDDDRVILDSDIMWYKREHILNNPNLFNFYITTDFATSDKKAADLSVISVWALDNNGSWYWVDGIAKRQLMDKNINDLFVFVQMYKPQSVGVEITGQQGGFIPWLQEQMLIRNVFFNLACEKGKNGLGIRPTTNKMERFNVIVPLFKLHKFYFPLEMKETPIIMEFLNELSLVAPNGMRSRHDDCLDTISMLGLMDTWKPSHEVVMQASNEGGRKVYGMDEEYLNQGNDYMDSYVV